MAIRRRKAAWNRNFFWIVGFRLTLGIRLFHIADDGLSSVVHVFITAPRAARAKGSGDWSPDQSNIAVLPSPKNAASGVQPWTILQ